MPPRRSAPSREAGSSPPDRLPAFAAARPDRSADRGPHPASGLQAGCGPGAGRRNGPRHPGRGARTGRGERGRLVRRHGLAAYAPGRHRAAPGEAAFARRDAGVIRPDFGVSGGPALSAGQARPFPRRQALQAADRVRAVVRRRGLSGGGGGVQGQCGRPDDGGRADQKAEGPLRAPAGGAGGRPGDADRSAHPRRGEAGRFGLHRRVAFFGDPVPGGVRGGADVAVRPNGPDRSAQRRLSGRAADGVPQPATGPGALAQARGPAASDGEVARSHRQGHQARERPS